MSIISNNCAGWCLYKSMRLPYDSPTIALQIMPEEFTKFCKDFKHYMSLPLMEYTLRSERHISYLKRLYQGPVNYPVDFPIGIVGDIMIAFQHYNSFQEAKEKWDRRKARIDYDNLNFIFVLDYDRYAEEAQEFSEANLDHGFVFTNGFDIPGKHYKYIVPEGACFLDVFDKRYVFEGDWRREELCH